MTHHEQLEDGAAATETKGISRRKMIVTGATLAVAGAAVGTALTMSASDGYSSASAGGAGAPDPAEPVMVHLKNMQSGELALFVGTRHTSFTDPAMAAQLVRHAASAI